MLKKFTGWLFRDWIAIFFMVIGVVLLLLTLAAFARGLNPIKGGGIDYGPERTVFSRFLLKMTTPALAIKILLVGRMPGQTTLLTLISYPLMFVVQIGVYGIVGKLVSALLTDWFALVFVYTGITLLALTLAFGIDSMEDSTVDVLVRDTALARFLLIASLPALIAGLFFIGMSREAVFIAPVYIAFMFVVQIVLYWFIGRAVGFMFKVPRRLLPPHFRSVT